MPRDAPDAKVNGARSLGARIVRYDRHHDDRDAITGALAADTAASLRAGHLITLPAVPDTIADGLRHTSPAPLPWEVNKVLLDDVVTVADDDIAQAMRWAFDYLKIVVEPSGAAGLAALAGTGLPPGPAGVIISGGSVDYRTYQALTGGLPGTPDRAVA